MEPFRWWDPAIASSGVGVDAFIADYFGGLEGDVLLIAGAGFDPRATVVASRLADVTSNLIGCFAREVRPFPSEQQVTRADANLEVLASLVQSHSVVEIEIFGTDGAVTGGRNAIVGLSSALPDRVQDIVLDISALSVGTAYPIARYLVDAVRAGRLTTNLHVFVTHDPELDSAIRSLPSDTPAYIHGFRGGSTLYDTADAARLWLPQLASGCSGPLGRLFDFVEPHDTCPILPFPSENPRLADELAEEYLAELESSWEVDTRNIVYADEADPLDLYRTILRLDELRRPVFAGAGGSMLILSPLGSKVMALGALLAALERGLPVAHVESVGYELDPNVPDELSSPVLVHVWLEGEAYPGERPPLLTD